MLTNILLVFLKEYTEEFRDIAKGSKSKEALPAAPITLINQRPVNEDLHVRLAVLYAVDGNIFMCFHICRNIRVHRA